MIQWYREGRFPIDKLIKHFNVRSTHIATPYGLLTSESGCRLPTCTYSFEGRDRNQTRFGMGVVMDRKVEGSLNV